MQVDQTAALQKGSADGQAAGAANGREKGEQRCYDAGYAAAYQKSYDEAKKLGLQDADSYNQGYAQGKQDANRIETEKGTNAGYENGFKQREAEIIGSFPSAQLVAAKAVRTAAKTWGPMRGGFFTTPEERMAYDRAYRSAYDQAYHYEYRREHDYAYNDAYKRAYQSSYNTHRQSGYQDGYTAGKNEAYQDAYKTAYNTQYNLVYTTEYNKEYADFRARGNQTGMTEGKAAGFNDGKAAYYKTAYDKGYQEVAAVAYPDAFNAGKQTGIAAAEKFYKENAVLEAADAVLYDENGNGKFEADENILMKVAVRNLGFAASKKITVAVVSEKGVVVFEKELTIDSIAARAKTSVDLKLGGLPETVAAGADKLVIKFTEADSTKAFSQQEKTYAIVNNATIGVITAEDAVVRKNPVPLLGKKLTELHRGDKVIILATAQMGFYKVRKPKASQGEWTEGYVPIKKVVVQK